MNSKISRNYQIYWMYQRNVYLKRTHSNTPHTYTHDMQTGKYYIQHSGNSREVIEKTGKLPTKFKPLGSGCFSSKKRYEQAKSDKNLLQFVPESTYKRRTSLYTPITPKFMGYMQYPHQTQIPEFLQMPALKALKTQKSDNCQRQIELNTLIRQHRRRKALAKRRQQTQCNNKQLAKPLDSFFESSMLAQQHSRPLPQRRKKSCYDDKCRLIQHVKRFSIESAIQLNAKQHLQTTMAQTINKLYFQKKILQQTGGFSP